MKHVLLAAVAATTLIMSGCAEAGPTTTLSESEIQDLVRNYILDNPEIIGEALIRMEENASRDAIVNASDALFNDPRDYSIGPKDAKVQLVEFFDYNCGYCKRSTAFVKEVMEKYPNDVRVIFKEMPVLDRQGGTSRLAAKAGLASARQGKYLPMHAALMEARGFTQEKLNEIAEENGLDIAVFEADMKDPALEQHINDTLMLANRIPDLTGTPFFVVNELSVSGAKLDVLDKMIQDALAAS